MTMNSHSRGGDVDLLLALNDVRDSFQLEDVSNKPASLAWAFDLVVQGYLSLSSQPLDPETVREEVCLDAYHRNGLRPHAGPHRPASRDRRARAARDNARHDWRGRRRASSSCRRSKRCS